MQALLFDLDGTLVDSIPLWIDANLHALRKRGAKISAREFLTGYYQRGLHYHGILEECGLSIEDADRFYEERNELYETYLKEKIEWLGDAGSILKRCAEKVPLGLMTGAAREAVDAMDPRLHLTNLFKEIITYDDTGRKMKPDPHGILMLTEKLSVDPKLCAYVGDQEVDVQAAHAAGMPCWLIPTDKTGPHAIAEADLVLKSIDELPMKKL